MPRLTRPATIFIASPDGFELERDVPRSNEVQRSHPHRERSEEHTSELQSHLNLVCRLLLEKKKVYSGWMRPILSVDRKYDKPGAAFLLSAPPPIGPLLFPGVVLVSAESFADVPRSRSALVI